MEENTQLPKEVEKALEEEASDKYSKMAEHAEDEKDIAYAQGYAEGWHSGATAYAKKLHQADNANKALEDKNRALVEENAKLKEQAEGWRPLFEDILRDNRNGYIDIDEALCSRIKKFLYGEEEITTNG